MDTGKMALYIYAPTLYDGTREVINTLNAKRLVRHDGMHFTHKGVRLEFGPKDAIVCWGAHVPPIPGVSMLNDGYTYPTMFDLNIRGLNNAGKQGIAAFIPIYIGRAEYRKGLEQAKKDNCWWPKKQPDCGYVSFPEFDGYGTQFYNFAAIEEVLVLGKKATYGRKQSQDFALDIMDRFDIDFAAVTVGLTIGAPQNSILLKIITAPALNAKGVELVTNYINNWYKQEMESKGVA